MTALPSAADLRCLNHPEREAAARCPSCRRYFCRECVSEHAGRMLCAQCLRAAIRSGSEAGRGSRVVGRVFSAAAGLVVVWLSLQLFGQYLASLPDASHERVLWRDDPLEQEDR